MIRLHILNTRNFVELDGDIEQTFRKIGYVKTETIYGSRKTQSIRTVTDLTIQIQYITEEEYYKLFSVFREGKELDVEEIDTGDYYTIYELDGDSFKLEKKEDYKTKKYYYKGSIELMKK